MVLSFSLGNLNIEKSIVWAWNVHDRTVKYAEERTSICSPSICSSVQVPQGNITHSGGDMIAVTPLQAEQRHHKEGRAVSWTLQWPASPADSQNSEIAAARRLALPSRLCLPNAWHSDKGVRLRIDLIVYGNRKQVLIKPSQKQSDNDD